ncbi:MAG: alpha/beta hydrolase [Pseudomonadota bacterium]
MPRLTRQFIDGPYGQIHLRIAKPEAPAARPLLCLHMSPKSGRSFASFMELASDDRIIVAPDYPGYGESDHPPAEPYVTVPDYAKAMWAAADALDLGPVDLLGYHTGSKVAAEMARQRPDDVKTIVMLSASLFTAEELAKVSAYFEPIPLDEEGTRFSTMWERIKHYRGPGMTLEMMAESMAENMRGGENYEWGHRAAFEYNKIFPDVVKDLPHRIRVINPGDDLFEQTARIAPLLQNGDVSAKPEWGHGFLEAYTEDATALIKSLL